MAPAHVDEHAPGEPGTFWLELPHRRPHLSPGSCLRVRDQQDNFGAIGQRPRIRRDQQRRGFDDHDIGLREPGFEKQVVFEGFQLGKRAGSRIDDVVHIRAAVNRVAVLSTGA